MIALYEIQTAVDNAYLSLAKIQYYISVREPVSGDPDSFTAPYVLSTKIVANLEYIEMLALNIDYTQNLEIENIVTSLKEITSKIKTKWA